MSTVLLVALTAFVVALVHGLVLEAWTQALGTQRDKGAGTAEPLFITVVVPARNAAETLAPLLQDLNAQQVPREAFEVVVVDDHSSDGTAELVQRFARTWPGLRLVLLESAQGKKAAITQGVEDAKGEVILVTDADARCGPLRLARMASYWGPTKPDLLLMPAHTIGGMGVYGWLQRKEQAALQAASMGSALCGRPVLANGANMAFSKQAFQRVRGFAGDAHASGDDMFLLQRMRKLGLRVRALAHPDVHVQVQAELGRQAFFSQRIRWAGKMWAYRESAGMLAAMAALLFPWALLACSFWLFANVRMGQGALYAITLLLGAWAVWSVPILRLVHSMERMHARASGAPAPERADGTWSTIPALILFSLYSLAVAILSIFVRPIWKGRRI